MTGVIGASYRAVVAGERNIITLDIGGTSADVSDSKWSAFYSACKASSRIPFKTASSGRCERSWCRAAVPLHG